MGCFKRNWHRAALLVIIFLTGFLSFYAIGREGYANQYYSAAVKSMLTSWHNFFFVSFDAGGYVSVDKPALGLWLQAISAFVFGFHGWSLILPEALSTVVSVALIYHLVQRSFGKTAGILSALILALTPILIAVSRTNNLDASLVMVVLFAAWAMIVAAERGSFRLLLLFAALVGLGFNIKMLEAFMVLPALYLVYMLTSPLKILKRVLQLTGATAVLLAVSFSWAAIVELTPADSRPYVGSSKTNSVIELALGYNGIQRVTGDMGMSRPGGSDGRMDANGSVRISDRGTQGNDGQMKNLSNEVSQSGNGSQDNSRQDPPDGESFQDERGRPGNGNMPGGFNPGPQRPGGPGGNGGPGGTGETGQKGIFRIFNEKLAGQISWFLIMALFGILVLCLKIFKDKKGNKKAVLRQLVLWSAWIAPMLVYFSISGFFHRYYLSMLAPGIAALAGIGIVEMWKAYINKGWRWVMLPAAFAANAVMQGCILWRYEDLRSKLIPVICGVCLLTALTLCIIRLLKKDNLQKTIKASIGTGLAVLLIAPAFWAYTPILYGSDTHLPNAGPELASNSSSKASTQKSDASTENSDTSKLINFLISKKQGEKFLVAVQDATAAEPIIIKTGEAVMAVGGYKGSDNILTVEKLENMVNNNKLRYFLVSGNGMGSQITNWVKEHGKVVSYNQENQNSQDGFVQSGGRNNNAGALYDLAPEKD